MKLLRQLFIVCLLNLSLTLPATSAEAPERLQLQVDGLVCAFCAQGIERKLKAESATDEVWVRLADGLVALTLKPGSDISDERLDQLLRDAGYSLRGVSRDRGTLDALRHRDSQS